MANNVFANGREISCKAGSGKSICAFPDVVMTPPQTPATPPGVPIPYPNTGKAGDMTSGSKKVKISNKEVMLKNKSYFKKSMGDEAGSAPLKGVVTHKNAGKVYFNMWSMDVKFEGENVVRHLDITTHNHASPPTNTPPWPFLDSMAFAIDSNHACADLAKEVKENCEKHIKKTKSKTDPHVKRKPSIKAMCDDSKCADSLKCVLSPKSPSNCCPQPQPKPPKQTPHHIVPASQFKEMGEAGKDISGGKYNYNAAPCICAEGVGHSNGNHGDIHTETNNLTVNNPSVLPHVSATGKSINPEARWKVSESEAVGAQATAKVTKCDKDCLEAQVRKGHQDMGISEDDDIRPTTAGSVTDPAPPPAIGID